MASVRGLSRRPVRRRTGRILVEGPQGVREAVSFAPERIVDLYATTEAAQRYAEFVEPAREQGVFVHETSEEVLAAMCDADTPQGTAAVVEWAPSDLASVLASSPRLLVLLAHVRDPGNLGTVIRGADAAGADAVLVSDASVDVTSPKVVRSTAGSLFHLPVVTGLDISETLTALGDAGITRLAADGAGERTMDDCDLTGPHVWVMGNEAWGLEDATLAACDEVVRVPIHGHAESLNLAMASTICLYASARQQRA
ncbi:RNA methyltransferase [Janibacter terrae]|uniref:TrmH family RNA methyltransferase n=1 Tax=Janibacter TaxID=53457 RepID=UPI0009EEDD9F|nr:RNA methyltransferase [Janibacter terrae]MBA4083880.1 RNA methyltransferase [Kytococcus sp.]HBO53763.1 RNA methyltransferase [Janibacter terrae]